MTRKRDEALLRLADGITPHDATVLLEALRWREDQIIRTYFDEIVYLGPCFNRAGERIGITECCFIEHPCEKHQLLWNQLPPETQKQWLALSARLQVEQEQERQQAEGGAP